MKTIPPPPPREVIRRHEEKILQEWFDDVEPFNQSEEYYVHEQRGKDVQNKQRKSGIARKAVAYRTPEERQGSWTAATQNAQRNQKPVRRSGRIYIRFLNSLCLCVTLVHNKTELQYVDLFLHLVWFVRMDKNSSYRGYL